MLLQTVNMALGTINQAEPETFSEKLIHRDALDLDTDDETFVRNLVEMAEERGMIRTQAQLQELIEQCSKVQQAYELTRFGVQPLTHPDQVTCYYFRNGSGLLLGQLEPYFKLPIDDVISVDHVNYWSEWEAEIEDFQMVDVDSSNHFMLLSEPKAKKPIMKFCQELYSKEGLDNSLLSQNDLESDWVKLAEKYSFREYSLAEYARNAVIYEGASHQIMTLTMKLDDSDTIDGGERGIRTLDGGISPILP